MQIATYINDLLFRYECVIVPGFGAFLTQYHSAIIDKDSNTFYPPGKTLSFNRQLQTNDGLLANYVSSIEKCSYDAALRQIRNFASTLSKKLNDGETVSLYKIGEFYLNNEHSVQFTPSKKENFSVSSFGLSSFVSPAISREVTHESPVHQKVKTRRLAAKTPYSIHPYLKYAAIGLIAITLTGIGGVKLYEIEIQKHNFVQKQKANDLVENQIQEATFVIESPIPSINITLSKKTGKYHIVAGAFRFEENAHKKVRQLEAKGFTPRIIGKNRYGLHQVVYDSYEDRVEAIRELRKVQRSENNDAWLLVEELTN